ncbi:hypothetical protein ACQP1V_42925 (plasmid) [Microtetraspora malaysiensis]|uniref:hypothetical protein n=1 Tax=Microtetraspora malaysiensis TaxID=161358 RepID=UPI003D8D46C7
MSLTKEERRMWKEAIEARNGERDFVRKLEHEQRLDRQRRQGLFAPERERIWRQMQSLCDIDDARLTELVEQDTAAVQDFMEKQRTVIAEWAATVNQRQETLAQRAGAPQRLIGPPPQAGMVRRLLLKTAADLSFTPSDNYVVEDEYELYGRKNFLGEWKNFIYLLAHTKPSNDAPIPPLLNANYVFRWTADADVTVGAKTTPALVGMSSAFAGGGIDPTYAEARYYVSIDIVVGTSTDTQVYKGEVYTSPTRSAQTDWFDGLGAYDGGPIYDLPTVHVPATAVAPAGSSVLFCVTITLDFFAFENSEALVDIFRDPSFYINVGYVDVSIVS